VIAQLYSGHRLIYYDLAAAAGEDERETNMIAPTREVEGNQVVDIPVTAHMNTIDKYIWKVGTAK
jgi:hypothetical protein